jgi:predicted nucleotidyltransferase
MPRDTKRATPAPAGQDASGRFVLRIPPGLHAALRGAARDAGLSLNDYCARMLAAPTGNLAAVSAATDVVAHAAGLVGEDLVGIVAYGSWVRGEATVQSDLDLLIVVAAELPLVRTLYRRWDRRRLTWHGRPIDPHFVHLLADDTHPSGLWAEAAIDGVVLFERALRISTTLGRVRRAIVDGRLVRRRVHGQPYWAEAS